MEERGEKITAVGEYPFMSLSEARAEALRIKSAVKFDKPVVEPKARTFRELAGEWLDKKIRGVRVQTHLESIEQRLAKHVYPYIAESAIDKLTLLVMLDILRHIERAWKIE